ncbi:hypothetical protein AO263_25150 [Pseudomonas sp. NZIPFR-PS5]|nr:hypothetical protein AO263_25150 [Pseudomonas sp. NZIPFR-PS5]
MGGRAPVVNVGRDNGIHQFIRRRTLFAAVPGAVDDDLQLIANHVQAFARAQGRAAGDHVAHHLAAGGRVGLFEVDLDPGAQVIAQVAAVHRLVGAQTLDSGIGQQ